MRCCKDLGIASELWDPSFIRRWKRNIAKKSLLNMSTLRRKEDMEIEKHQDYRLSI